MVAGKCGFAGRLSDDGTVAIRRCAATRSRI
jgi:hypothetical protein